MKNLVVLIDSQAFSHVRSASINHAIDLVETTAAALARFFKSFESLRKASFSDLMQMDNIGEVVAKHIVHFFALLILEYLL